MTKSVARIISICLCVFSISAWLAFTSAGAHRAARVYPISPEDSEPMAAGIPAPGIYIDGDVFIYDWDECPWVNGSGTTADPYVIHDLDLDDGAKIVIKNTEEVFRIENCTMRNCGTGIDLSNVKNGVIKNNTISRDSTWGIHLGDDSSNNTIEDNNCTGAYCGVSLEYSSNNTLRNNFFRDNYCGIEVDRSDNVVLEDNNCSWNRIGIESSFMNNSVVSGNNCTSNNFVAAIIISSSSHDNKIIKNTCTNNSGHGLFFTDDYDPATPNCMNNLVRENNCSENQVSGIYLNQDCESFEITQNNCSRNTEYGIGMLASIDCEVTGNFVTKNGLGQIQSWMGSGNIITGNFVADVLKASFNVNYSTIVDGQSVGFTSTTTGGWGNLAYQWNFDDGPANSTLEAPVHRFIGAATRNVVLTVSDEEGDQSAASRDITVETDVGVSVTFSTNVSTSIAGQFVQFTPAISGGNDPVSCNWTFGDSTTTSSQHPAHPFTMAGTWTVTLTVTDFNGDQAAYSKDITVLADLLPVAGFTLDATTITADQQVQFTDTTAAGNAPLTYEWDFGDGTPNATIQNPTHAYTATGTYTVTLKVTDADGDISFYQKQVTVQPASGGDSTGGIGWSALFLAVFSGATVIALGRANRKRT